MIVQITSAGMEPGHLKKTYGDRLCLWGGGCDTRDVLPHGTPREVRDHVRRQVDTLGPGGGFVFQPFPPQAEEQNPVLNPGQQFLHAPPEGQRVGVLGIFGVP